ncbi:hypothetical protein ON010_g10622 [Phytophthora cinnamomi]|nr:hypothetical protein ON010_g10622 [Phytophthora cinnamomi]
MLTCRDRERAADHGNVRVPDLNSHLHDYRQQNDGSDGVRNERREANHKAAERNGDHPHVSGRQRVND